MTTTLAAGVENILKVWDAATPDQLHRGRTWYAEANRTAQIFAQTYRRSTVQAAGVLAALSPNNSWAANVRIAERVLATGDTSRGYFRAGLDKARRILDGENPADVFKSDTYYKVSNFYRAILSNGRDGVCVDRHAWDVYTGTRHADKAGGNLPVRPKVAGKRYLEAQAAYEAAGEALTLRTGRHVSGCEVQAVTWLVWRRQFWGEGAFDTDTIGTGEFADLIFDYLMAEVAA